MPYLRLALAVLFCAACAHGEDTSDLGTDAAVAVVCGDRSCAPGESCEGGECHLACATRARCGTPEMCCPAGDVCYLSACTTPGVACSEARPDGGACGSTSCPDGQACDPALARCLPKAPTGVCEYKPPVGSFDPEVKWAWSTSTVEPEYVQIMMTPAVADLDGDCIPDIVFSTFKNGNYVADGIVRAVRGDGSGELWSASDPALRVYPGAGLALADVDGDGRVEVFACQPGGAVLSLYSDGKLKWISSATPCGGYSAPSLADTDHDGIPELILGLVQLDARTGAVKNPGPTPAVYAQMSTAAELDGDVANGMEIIGGGAVVHADGTLYWADAATLGDASPAIGDLDLDGKPDVVFVSPGNHTVTAYDHAGVVMWGPIDVNNGVPTLKGPGGGGPPTIADFDGDGKPDVATAGGYGYLVLRGTNGAVLWQSTVTQDTSSRVTGSSVFDFEGDGAAEAIYNDERDLRVYRGSDGAIRLKLCSTSGTLYENPIVADVDGDNHAEIVVVSNNYAINTCDADVGGGPSSTGFKVIGDAKRRWVTTRRVWNQHTYHVTNIADDMQVPQNELSNWAQPGLNNFRQNVQPSSVFAAPDLVASFLRATYDACPDRVTLLLTVLNQGASGVAAGVPVTFYYSENGTDKVLGTVKLATGLLPGGSTTVSYEWNPTPSGSTEVYAVVGDDGTGTLIVNECNDLNNTSATISVGCPGIL